MEIHSVLPEERARDENNNFLPWGYRYADASKNPRQPPEESGPFGRHRSTSRYSGSVRASRTRTGTTPIRKVEDPTIAEFSRIFSTQQKEEDELRSKNTVSGTATTDQPTPRLPTEPALAQECTLWGYASKAAEWKVISKYEKISNGRICEDYPRTDPDVALNNRTAVVVPPASLSKDALKKSRTYRGGKHWIKVTFDSYSAAERACFYSPQEIDGHLVFCEMWNGRGPFTDQPLLKGSHSANEVSRNTTTKMRTLTSSQSTNFLASQDAIGRFKTLPRSATLPDLQYGAPTSLDDSSTISNSSTTASSATAIGISRPGVGIPDSATTGLEVIAEGNAGVRSRSVPSLPATNPQSLSSEYMTAIPTVKRAVLRPMSEALAPQPTIVEKVLRSIPIVNLFFGSNRSATGGEIIGSGPIVKEDGTFDENTNGWYWSFWYAIDQMIGTDFCGLKGED